jgi:N-acylneuraminate cytidylyltransferase
MKIFAFIYARGGSKILKNKNLQKIKGKSLVERKIIFVKKTRIFDEIFLSSDSNRILHFGKKNKINLIKRPKKLSQDDSEERKAWVHAINSAYKISKFDIMVVLPCTSPFTKKIDIIKCLNIFKKIKSDLVTTISESERSPYFNMVSKNNSNFIKILINKKKFNSRKNLKKIYNLSNSIYVARPEYIMKNNHIYKGKVQGCIIPHSRSLDIDTNFDLQVARKLTN